MNGETKIGVIILAAGSSSRLGYPKQLVKFRGKSLLEHTIAIADSLELDIQILVLGAKAPEIQEKIDRKNFTIVINTNWEEGMGTSISKGVSEALKLENGLDHILMMLSDQPFVTKEKIQELIRVHLENNAPATFSRYAGEVGVPAIFSRQLFSDLQKLTKDQGAKKLLLVDNIKFGSVSFEGGNFDVDTPADVELLRQMEKE